MAILVSATADSSNTPYYLALSHHVLAVWFLLLHPDERVYGPTASLVVPQSGLSKQVPFITEALLSSFSPQASVALPPEVCPHPLDSIAHE
jgi:hypothetical protein